MGQAVAYSDIPQGFNVYSDIPAGFKVAGDPSAVTAAPAMTQPAQAHPLAALTVGVDPATLWERLKGAAATAINPLFPSGDVAHHNAQLPALTSEQQVGEKAAVIGSATEAAQAGASALWNSIKSRLPSTEHAGTLFEKIREAAKDEPVNMEEPYKVIQRAKELEATGHGPLSTGMTKLETALQPARIMIDGKEILIDPAQIKYPQGFDFASAAKRLSASEAAAQTGQMPAQVKKFAQALQSANREAAAQVGMGDAFDAAMKEYHQAMKLRDAVEAGKDALKSEAFKVGAVTAIGGTVAYEIAQKFFRGNR